MEASFLSEYSQKSLSLYLNGGFSTGCSTAFVPTFLGRTILIFDTSQTLTTILKQWLNQGVIIRIVFIFCLGASTSLWSESLFVYIF